MIQELKIQNFKSIRELVLRCRRVNVLIGEPNTGKTNVLESLGLFCPPVVRHMRKILRVSESVDLFRDQNLTAKILVGCDDASLVIEATADGLVGAVCGQSDHQLTPYFNFNTALQALNGPGTSPLKTIHYYLFDKDASQDQLQSTRLEPPFGENIVNLLYASKDARQTSSRFFVNTGFRLNVDFTHRRLLLTKEVDDTLISFPYASASETLRRMVFYHLAMDTGGGGILVFDEPEAHSFPPFTKTFAERIATDGRKTQYFLTTHSPYMLDSLLAKTPKDDLNIMLCRMENFETKVYTLNEAQKARLMEWSMDSFFNFDRLLEEA